MRQALDSEDYREGPRAFLEKRLADFVGRYQLCRSLKVGEAYPGGERHRDGQPDDDI